MTTALIALRVGLALACVLGLIWFAGRKLTGTAGLRGPRSVPMTVIGRQSLGKGAGIALVEVAGRVLLLGVGDQGVRILTEIDVPTDLALGSREDLDLESLPRPHPDGSARAGVSTVGGVTGDPNLPAHLTGLAVSSSAREAGALHGSVLSGDTWRRAVDVVQQRTLRR